MQAALPYLVLIFCIYFTFNLLSTLATLNSWLFRFIVFVSFGLFSLHFYYHFLVAIFTLESQDLIKFSINSLETLLCSDYHCLVTSGYVIVKSLDTRVVSRYRWNYNKGSELLVQLIYFIWEFSQKEYFFYALTLEIAYLRYFYPRLCYRNSKTEIIIWGVIFWVLQYFFRTWTFEEFTLYCFISFGSIAFYFISLYFFYFLNCVISFIIFQYIHVQDLENLDYRSTLITLIHNNKSNYILVLWVVLALVFNSFVFIVSELFFENYWKNFSFLAIFGFSYFFCILISIKSISDLVNRLASNTLSIGFSLTLYYFMFQSLWI